MKIKELLKSSGIACYFKDNFEVNGVSAHSKTVKKDFLFIAVKGVRGDGFEFIPEAIKNGARVIIYGSSFRGQVLDKKTIYIKVKDTRAAVARIATAFYGSPSRRLKVAGVTGTNGKTTVTYLMEAIIKKAGYVPGVIGTINYRYKNKTIPSVNTTPGPIELESMLAQMKRAGVTHVAMEVSSHALDQQRTRGIDFRAAVFTNITQDHLDYHKTRARYLEAKSLLFSQLPKGSWAVINNDDRHAGCLKKETRARVITYGIDKKADVMASDIHFDVTHTEFIFVYGKQRMPVKTRLIGKYNVYNILAAAAWALASGFSLKVIKASIESFGVVPGRLERVACNKEYSVLVDYAHTEDALKNVIGTLQQLAKKKIIVVFGCGGDRDRSKRPKMGRVVTEMADFAVISSDNPRSEDPAAIVKEIKKGIRKNNYCVVLDRRQAIKKSLSLACCDDIVLLAGKGHEDYQVIGNKKIHFDDREVVRECLSLKSC